MAAKKTPPPFGKTASSSSESESESSESSASSEEAGSANPLAAWMGKKTGAKKK